MTLALLSIFALSACGDRTSGEHTDVDAMPHADAASHGAHHDGNHEDMHADGAARTDGAAAPMTDLPPAVATPWGEATEAYLAGKDALTRGEHADATLAASRLADAIDRADMAAMDESHDAWMEVAPGLAERARAMAQTASIEAARERLPELTEALIAGVERFGAGGRELFVQHCPMAFDNAGADWVSADREVRNPYFGEAMMTCGRVTREL